MKRKSGFIVRQISGQNVAVAVGETSKTFHGMIKLNDSGLFIWNKLERDVTEDEIVDAMTEEYDVDRDRAAADVKKIIEGLRNAGILDD